MTIRGWGTLVFVLFLAGCGDTHPVTPAAPAPVAGVGMIDASQKLDAKLRAMVEAARSKSPGAVEQATQAQGIVLADGLISVKITANKAQDAEGLEKLVSQLGGKTTTKLGVAIFALLPPAKIESVAADARVWNMTTSEIVARPMNP